MTLALQTLSSQFRLLNLHITIQFQQAGSLPDFKGSMLHGWLGHALKDNDSQSYHILFHHQDDQQPKPYVICPNGDHKTEYKQGELYTFEMSLFGEATLLGDQVADAIVKGANLGFGSRRTPFKLVSIASNTPEGLKPGIVITSLQDWLTAQIEPETQTEMAIEFVTPLRCKYQGSVVRKPVADLNFYCNQTLRRISQLTQFWVNDDKTLIDALYQQQLPIQVTQSEAHGYFEDWQRYSQRQKEQLPFGGVKGQVSFYGYLGLAPVLLQAAEVLHLGGKTTFGLGKIKQVY
jgi:CRISPR/Cas system endoribonuclease Cas6 (RAMP superfamily)